jgi:Heterokaryon incompatibility protein (HET)
VKISNVHSDVDFRLYVDPWQLYLSDNLSLRCGASLEAKLINAYRIRWLAPFSPKLFRSAVGSTDELDCSDCIRIGDERMPKYSYKQLRDASHVRLLSLSPGDDGTELRAVIHHTSLDSAKQYNALSYVWRPKVATHHLRTPDEATHHLRTPDGSIDLTASLYSALQRLRDENDEIMLWVDAICINQNDNKEKAMQIRLMSRIFNTASCVIAYLGEEQCQSSLALTTLMQIKINSANPKKWPDSRVPAPLSWGGGYIPPARDTVWEPIVEFFARPWFRRVWIIQEIIVAAKVKVVCGEWTIDWNDLFSAIEVCDHEIKIAGDDFRFLDEKFAHFRILATFREWQARRTCWGLFSLLESFRYAEATLQRDRLFALLGFAADSKNPAFAPDYDVPFESIVLRYARAFVKQGKALDLLYRAGLGSQPKRFPSWIPDWTTEKSVRLYDSIHRSVPSAPMMDIEFKAKFGSNKDELVIQSLLVDKVVSVSQAANLPEPESLESYLGEVDEMVDSLVKYPTDEDLSNLKWIVPIAGLGYLETACPVPLDFFHSSYRSLRGFFGSPRTSLDPQEASQGYINALQGALVGWRFLVTRRGYVGVAPNIVQDGDIIGFFGGSAVPFLMRKSGIRAGAYRLIGECYIHGIGDKTKVNYLGGVDKSEIRLY